MATKTNPVPTSKSSVTAEQIRFEIGECRLMVEQVERLLRRHNGALRRH